MNRFQLAKLVSWAGTIRGRKRLQKVVCLLQVAGCKLDADFFLHFYGPYSRDVADVCDEMVAAGLLSESTTQHQVGTQFDYALTDRARELLNRSIAEPRFVRLSTDLDRYKDVAQLFLKADLAELELASTIAYFFDRDNDWNTSIQKASEFKKVDRDSSLMVRATALADRARYLV